MSESLLFWMVLALAFGAGVGTTPTIQLFRTPHPGHRAKKAEPAAIPPPLPPAPPARPRTLHHDYDTLDVLGEGIRIGQREQVPLPAPVLVEAPPEPGSSEPLAWSGPAATWHPRPYAVPEDR